jgi:alpha-glucosidase (family GH31 glycosyl hydrolase)
LTSIDKHFAPDMSKAMSKKESVFKGNTYRITVLSERLLRLEYNPKGVFNDNLTLLVSNRDFSIPKFKIEEDSKYIVITTKYFMMQYSKERPFKGPFFAPDSYLKVKLNNTDKIWYITQPEARNYKSSSTSLDNYPHIKLENGLYSTDGFATINDSNPIIRNENGILQKTNSEEIDIYLFMYKRDFGLCLKDYFTLTGYPPLLPRYALGIWWNRDRIYNFDNIKELIKTFNKYEIPLSVLLLSEFWHIKDASNINAYKTGFTFNNILFPNPEELTKYMHQRGVKLGLNIDPTEGIRIEESGYKNMAYDLGLEGKETIPFNIYDKMFAINYLDKLINPLLDKGVDFLWLDYKDDLDNLKALDYYHMKTYERNNEKRAFLLTRNSLTSSHLYGALYSGETEVSWNELRYLPFYNSNSSNIGLSWWSHDVGGYKNGIEDSELYLRYVQLATFSPIFRFSAMRGPYYKREPWLWDIKTYTITKDYCNLRQKLIPYIYTENYKYHHTGLPLIQPLYYNYPEIYDEPDYKNEYYFGSELLVSPITKQKDLVMNRAVERIYLPSGIWYDYKTGKKFVGDKRYVVFYKDEDYPVFIKAGGILPFSILKDNRNDVSNPKEMEIQIFPGKSNIYKLYEDDGYSSLYKEGYYIITAIDYNYMANNYTVIIHPIEGKTEIIPRLRDYIIKFRNTKKADSIELFSNDSKANNRYESTIVDNDFVVKIFDVDTTKQLTINCRGKDIEIDAVRIINEDINSIISDLKIKTSLKEDIAAIIFSNKDIKLKRIAIKKLKRKGLDQVFIKMFMKLLEYIAEI